MSNLLLLSGGLDSALCLRKFGASLCVGFDYGQPHSIELKHASKLAAEAGVDFIKVFMPDIPKVNELVFAGRNAVMISFAASIAQSRGIGSVTIGCNLSDSAEFPDCRSAFLSAMNLAIKMAYGITLLYPLIGMSKREIVNDARSLGISGTWTCYSPIEGRPCGACYSCKGLQS